jgi:hypothetical protein
LWHRKCWQAQHQQQLCYVAAAADDDDDTLQLGDAPASTPPAAVSAKHQGSRIGTTHRQDFEQ